MAVSEVDFNDGDAFQQGGRKRRHDDDMEMDGNQQQRKRFAEGQVQMTFLCPVDKAGKVIGKGGQNIKDMRESTGGNITLHSLEDRDYDVRRCVVTGTITQEDFTYSSLYKAVLSVIETAFEDNIQNMQKMQVEFCVPQKFMGMILGKGGKTIERIRNDSQAIVIVANENENQVPLIVQRTEAYLKIFGFEDVVKKALECIFELVAKNPDVLQQNAGQAAPRSQRQSRSLGTARNRDMQLRDDFGFDAGVVSVRGGRIQRQGGMQRQNKSTFQAKRGEGVKFAIQLLVDQKMAGVIIGQKGQTIRELRGRSKCSIQMHEGDRQVKDRVLEVSGEVIDDNVSNTENGVYECVQRLVEQVDINPSIKIIVSSQQAGVIIGKKGAHLKLVNSTTRNSTQLLRDYVITPKYFELEGAAEDAQVVQVAGASNDILEAVDLICVKLRENALKNAGMFPGSNNNGNNNANNNGVQNRPQQFNARAIVQNEPIEVDEPAQGDDFGEKLIQARLTNSQAGAMLGKRGQRVQQVRKVTNSSVILRDIDNSGDKQLLIQGSTAQLTQVIQLLNEYLAMENQPTLHF